VAEPSLDSPFRGSDCSAVNNHSPLQPSIVRSAVISDLLEEHWPSMDLVSQMLVEELSRSHSPSVVAELIRPNSVKLFGHLPIKTKLATTADRGFNRFVFYPHIVKRLLSTFDVFHIVDHSYAHLAHYLPPNRTVVTCHDIDAFRCLVDDKTDRRGWYPLIAKRLLSGMRRASRVICVSRATHDEIVKYGLVGPEKLTIIPNGVDPHFSLQPDPEEEHETDLLNRQPPNSCDILHVGSNIARKRIDILLEVFAKIRVDFREARLIRVGGPFTLEQEAQIDRLQLRKQIVVAPFVSRRALAAIYRRAAVVLMTSESEGFGLPVVEAMACGTPVVCSDIPALREVGGSAAVYCEVGDIDAWRSRLRELLLDRKDSSEKWQARRKAGLVRSQQFSWASNAIEVVKIYRSLPFGETPRSVPISRSV
jgi:glycosyltransferase involved in cell wall biosynthesis